MVAVALPNAKTAGSVFRDEILYKYGVPEQVVSDQDTAFTSGVWAEMMESLGIQHSFAAAEHQQRNELVERNNGVLVDRLAAFFEENPDAWDAQLSAAVFAINTGIQASTLTVPFQALFGILPRLPGEALLPQAPDPEAGEDRSEHMERLRASMAVRFASSPTTAKGELRPPPIAKSGLPTRRLGRCPSEGNKEGDPEEAAATVCRAIRSSEAAIGHDILSPGLTGPGKILPVSGPHLPAQALANPSIRWG